MEKIKTSVETFVAIDGKTFTNQESCEKHEAELLEIKKIKDKRDSILAKLNAIDLSDNDVLYELFLEGYFDYHFSAFKFVYHSDCSLTDVMFAAECEFTFRKEPIYTIQNEEEVKFFIDEFPQLKVGETYIVINFQDLSGDYYHNPHYFLANLDEYKEYLCRAVNSI